MICFKRRQNINLLITAIIYSETNIQVMSEYTFF